MCIPLPRKRESQWNYMKQGVLGEQSQPKAWAVAQVNSQKRIRQKMNRITMAIVLGLAALTTPTFMPKANAQTVYSYRAYDYDYVRTNYAKWSSYDIYVSGWGNTKTKTEYFSDSIGRRWNLVETTYDIVPGYTYSSTYYVNTELRYYRLCGDTYYSRTTGCWYYRCKCGRTFVYDPLWVGALVPKHSTEKYYASATLPMYNLPQYNYPIYITTNPVITQPTKREWHHHNHRYATAA